MRERRLWTKKNCQFNRNDLKLKIYYHYQGYDWRFTVEELKTIFEFCLFFEEFRCKYSFFPFWIYLFRKNPKERKSNLIRIIGSKFDLLLIVFPFMFFLFPLQCLFFWKSLLKILVFLHLIRLISLPAHFFFSQIPFFSFHTPHEPDILTEKHEATFLRDRLSRIVVKNFYSLWIISINISLITILARIFYNFPSFLLLKIIFPSEFKFK